MAYQPKSYRKFLVGAVSTAVVASSFAGVAGAASYSDVNSKYQEAVNFVVSKGINGTSATTFGTYENIKRVDAAVFVAAVLGLNTTSAPDAGFTDVPNRAKGAVNALKAAGITSGKSATTFGAQDFITRGELAVWIQKGFGLEAGYQTLAFTDVPSQYANAVFALVSNKVTSGTSASTFGTYDNAKRGDFAFFLKRAADAKIQPTPPKQATILKMDGDSKGNKLANGEKKTYTVTLTNPVSGNPVEGADINVTFEENVGTDFGPQRNVTVTNPKTGHSVIPYQANDGTERTLVVTTDKDGKATFTVTGDNATVTPIAFLDGSNQKFDTKGGIEFTTKDDRFDKNVEYFVKGTAVTFGVTEYKIALEGKRTNYAAINFGQKLNGREYVITVTKPDGTAYAGGVANVGVLEDLDDVLGNNTKGAFITDKDGVGISTVKLDSKGQATIVLASTAVNDSARPFVWIDQNEGTNPQSGKYEKGEPVSNANVAPTNFQPERVDNGTLGAELKIKDGAAEDSKDVTLKLLNQSGKPFTSEHFDKDARVTFQVKNTGVNDIDVLDENGNLVGTVNEGGTKTFARTISNDTKITLRVAGVKGGNSSAEVTVDGVVKWYEQSESQSVAVNAGPVKVNLGDSYAADVTAKAQDTNGGLNDQVVLTFTQEVFNFEAGDFRLDGDATKVANSVTKDGKKLILTFSEAELDGATNITYDASFSGDKALANDLGDKVLPFTKAIN